MSAFVGFLVSAALAMTLAVAIVIIVRKINWSRLAGGIIRQATPAIDPLNDFRKGSAWK